MYKKLLFVGSILVFSIVLKNLYAETLIVPLKKPSLTDKEIIEKFINITKSNNKLCGLSGSLRIEHINELKQLNPNFLGFRGQLCETASDRKNLSIDMLNQVSKEIKLNS